MYRKHSSTCRVKDKLARLYYAIWGLSSSHLWLPFTIVSLVLECVRISLRYSHNSSLFIHMLVLMLWLQTGFLCVCVCVSVTTCRRLWRNMIIRTLCQQVAVMHHVEWCFLVISTKVSNWSALTLFLASASLLHHVSCFLPSWVILITFHSLIFFISWSEIKWLLQSYFYVIRHILHELVLTLLPSMLLSDSSVHLSRSHVSWQVQTLTPPLMKSLLVSLLSCSIPTVV